MQNNTRGPIPGSYWVVPGKLLAGSYPGSPWARAGVQTSLDHLLEAGITLFVDLTEPGERTPYRSLLPPEICCFNRPIQNYGIPTPEQMRDILNTIDTALDQGQMVYLHCYGGMGRTGTVVGCYLVRHGLAGQDALAEIVRRRGDSLSPETDEQRQLVLGWSAEK